MSILRNIFKEQWDNKFIGNPIEPSAWEIVEVDRPMFSMLFSIYKPFLRCMNWTSSFSNRDLPLFKRNNEP